MALPFTTPARPRAVLAVRELVKEDLSRLREPRRGATIKKLRDSHHAVARLFAAGLRTKEVAARSGYTYGRVATLHSSPAFQQLVEEYRGVVNQSFVESLDDYFELGFSNMLKAERQIADRLEEAEDEGGLPVRELIAISRDAADRFGYGKRQTNVNINADFAALLEKAIRRSGKQIELSRATVGDVEIEGKAASARAPHGGDLSPPNPGVAAYPFRRRA